MLILDRRTLARRLASKTGGARNVWRIRAEGKTGSGRVKTVAVSVGKRVVRMSGAAFRSLVGYNDLRSARFEITERGESVEFKGTGWGHGVGICQEGAGALARQGWKFDEILRHYFPGARIVRLRR
jgi:stage II sporulation protein D